MARPALKAEFIRTQPIDMPVKDLQRAAKREGHGTLGPSYITKVRREMNAEHAMKALRKEATKVIAANPTRKAAAAVSSGNEEQQLRAIVVVLGTKRVRQIIDEVEAQLMGSSHG